MSSSCWAMLGLNFIDSKETNVECEYITVFVVPGNARRVYIFRLKWWKLDPFCELLASSNCNYFCDRSIIENYGDANSLPWIYSMFGLGNWYFIVQQKSGRRSTMRRNTADSLYGICNCARVKKAYGWKYATSTFTTRQKRGQETCITPKSSFKHQRERDLQQNWGGIVAAFP